MCFCGSHNNNNNSGSPAAELIMKGVFVVARFPGLLQEKEEAGVSLFCEGRNNIV